MPEQPEQPVEQKAGGAVTPAPAGARVGAVGASPEAFLAELLVAQCHAAPARAGAILRARPGAAPEPVALYPATRPGQSAPAWLTRAAEALAEGNLRASGARLVRLEGGEGYYGEGVASIALLPFPAEADGAPLAGAYLVRSEPGESSAILQRLDLSARLLEVYALRARVAEAEADQHGMRMVLEACAAAAGQDRFQTSAMALVNHVAASWEAERVSLGLVKSGAARVRAISHTERLAKASALLQAIEAAMEESLDQDVEVVHPAGAEARRVGRSARELAEKHGNGGAVCTLPLRRRGEVIGALTVERTADRPFSAHEVEALRLVCELCGVRLAALSEHDRWVGARAAAEARRGLGALLGPRHTWLKMLAVVLLAGAVFLTFANGMHRVEAPFRLEAVEARVVPAPFDGFLREVSAEVGDRVEEAGAPLARLDDTELQLQLAAAEAEYASHQREVAVAMRERKEAEAQIARALADKSAAEAALLRRRIEQATLTAPIAGVVVAGDLKRVIGAPVSAGDALFEIAPIDALRAEVFVPESDIGDVEVGQRGRIATASYPDRRIPIEVERIDPVAEVREQRNVFRVRVRLLEEAEWLRPGMEGSARIDVQERRLAWIWTHRVADWLRMKLWI